MFRDLIEFRILIYIFLIWLFFVFFVALDARNIRITEGLGIERHNEILSLTHELNVERHNKLTFTAYVTGYNSTKSQTDETPCLAAGGYICGRHDVIACPRIFPLTTRVKIDGKEYICLDRKARHHDSSFDIFCDKDIECPSKVTGWKEVTIY